MTTDSVVKGHPVLDDAAGFEVIVDFFEIDGLLLQGSPQALDEDVVETAEDWKDTVVDGENCCDVYYDDWRDCVSSNKWDCYDAEPLFNDFVRAMECAEKSEINRIRSELEALQVVLREIVPRAPRKDGIEETPDFKSPEEFSYRNRCYERHMKAAAHFLRRAHDLLEMDFSDAAPTIPTIVEEAREYVDDWISKEAPNEEMELILLSQTRRNQPIWHAAHLRNMIDGLDKMFALIQQPGAYRIGKKDILIHMAEASENGVRIGQHYEILKRKWVEELAAKEQKQDRGRRYGSDTNLRKNATDRNNIIGQFREFRASGVSRADAVTRIARAYCAEYKEKNIKTESKRVRQVLSRHYPEGWNKK